MRTILNLNQDWKFVKKAGNIKEVSDTPGETVNLPHTWNAIDGQDGGNDYYRGICYYKKDLQLPDCSADTRMYLQFEGANSSADVYLNEKLLIHHDGGYSTFRCRIDDALSVHNELIVAVNNSPDSSVYPQKADFTFYGGLYRSVSLIMVSPTHFDLENHGSSGLQITPHIHEHTADVTVDCRICGNADTVVLSLSDNTSIVLNIPVHTEEICTVTGVLHIPDVHLWNGTTDPYLYTLTATLLRQNTVQDEISSDFGCRFFSFDSEYGFMLNGQSYPLHGVARHQDRQGVGNALTRSMHEEDISLIREMGANCIRLAHYQHDQYFYDLCDRNGLIVWAEIPCITSYLENGNDNAFSQLTELILQNYNHPSIICWGLSNEITAGGISPALTELHSQLNDLAHMLDPTRPTTMAHVFMLDTDDPLMRLPDICSYNLYYGWYLGNLEDNDRWFDEFHARYPDRIIGLSEYGADANPEFQTEHPEKNDYTQAYQCLYHEHMLKMLMERPYIWSSFCWNMFDFGADGRDEGGAHGLNQKGLVSFDRKFRKDAFYLYKAYLSDTPFIHLCGKGYLHRTGNRTQIKVYTNQNTVSLYDHDQLIQTIGGNRIFCFEIPLTGRHHITVTAMSSAGLLTDTMDLIHVDTPDPAYVLQHAAVRNWFEEPGMEIRKGFYSIKDSIGDIRNVPEGAALIDQIIQTAVASRGDVAKSVRPNAQMEKIMNQMSVETLIKQAAGAITADMVVALNKALSKIQKSKGDLN